MVNMVNGKLAIRPADAAAKAISLFDSLRYVAPVGYLSIWAFVAIYRTTINETGAFFWSVKVLETLALTLWRTVWEGHFTSTSFLALYHLTPVSGKWPLAPGANEMHLLYATIILALAVALLTAIVIGAGKRLIAPYLVWLATGCAVDQHFTAALLKSVSNVRTSRGTVLLLIRPGKFFSTLNTLAHLGKNPEMQIIGRQPRKGKSSETIRQTLSREDIVRSPRRRGEHRRNDDARFDYNTIKVGNTRLGEIQFDRVFSKVKNTIVDPHKQQTDMKTKAIALTFNHYLINGDSATDSNGFEGLKKRVAGMPARQSIYAAGVAGDSTAALDVTGSVANCTTFFKKLEEMVTRTNGGNVNAILCNEAMKLGIGHAARYVNAGGGAFLSVTKDSFDRDIPTFRGAPIIDVGLKVDQSTEIITDSETANDSGADGSSIYGVSFSEQDGIVGIQLPPGLEVYDPGGELDSYPSTLTRFEWVLGLAGFGSYGITRMRNVEGASNWTA